MELSKMNQTYQAQIASVRAQYETEINATQNQNLNFLNDYSIALIDIHVASGYADMANVNLDYLKDYTSPNGTGQGVYVYASAARIADGGKDQATKAKDYLTKARSKLQAIADSAPNAFFKEDIANRINQTDILTTYANQVYNLLEYYEQELYQVNYGSNTNAMEFLNKYNALVPQFNSNLKELSDLQNKIDLQWDQDWYPSFQESAEYPTLNSP